MRARDRDRDRDIDREREAKRDYIDEHVAACTCLSDDGSGLYLLVASFLVIRRGAHVRYLHCAK